MYEDSWYNFVPELSKQQPTNASAGHRRRASTLLQQPNGTGQDGIPIRQAPIIVDEAIEDNGPPRATVPQRAASFSDLGRAARDTTSPSKSVNTRRDENAWDALMIGHDIDQLESLFGGQTASEVDSLEAELLDASQENYLLYRDQLLLTERHLDGLIHDANETLELLTKLSTSFQSVEEQTSTFRSRCDELLMEQDKLRKVHDGIENDMRYYAYLETASRRLNAPGASKLVDDSQFADMMEEIDSCISFMAFHDKYRERDSYLARYEALLAKALHLLDIGFTTHLDKVSSDIARQISANTSQSTWHALAYGRFEELMTNSYSLLPNVQRVMRLVFDEYGNRLSTTADTALYANTATSMMRTYLTTRDRDLKQLTQHDISEYQKQAQDVSVETASRNLIKQVFERMQHEASILTTLFDLDIAWNASPESAFQTIRGVHTSMAHPANMTPLATRLQTVLQTAGLKSVCNVVGWVANEYSIAEVDDEETAESRKLREYAARLLAEHLWPFTDAAFEAEVAKSITKATVDDSSLKISEVVDNIAWSNAHPLTKAAIELLSMFDQAMPKERSTKNSKVIFTIVRETIQVLQRAEARIKTLRLETDSDLFMVKNLLIVKNELVSLEIGDIRGNQPANMQHFTQIWDTLSPQNWAGFLGSMLPSSFWGGSSAAAPSVTAKTLTVEDMSEQLDELLRQSIYGFTKRWGDQLRASRQSKGKATATKDIEGDLDSMLRTAFSGQPEVITKLFEAIEIHAEEGGAETS